MIVEARDRRRLVRPFLDATVTAEDDVIDDYHPIILNLHTWKKWFDRVKMWELTASSSTFNAVSDPFPMGRSGAATPDELSVVEEQFYRLDDRRFAWFGETFKVEENPPFDDMFAQFFLYSAQSFNDQTEAHRINAMHWNAGNPNAFPPVAPGSRVAASLIFRILVSGAGANLSSVPDEVAGSDTVDLRIDSGGQQPVSLRLYGYDNIGLTLSLVPKVYWSFRGIYRTDTGAVRPNQSVWSNTRLP